MTQVKDLGLIQAMYVGATAPINKLMIWFDTSVGEHKFFDTVLTAWTSFTSPSTAIGDLSSLITTDKTSLVNAVNEVKQNFLDLIAGAGGAYDTLLEIQTELQDNDTDITTILTNQGTISTALTKRVAVDAVQAFSAGEKTQGRANLEVYGTTEIDNFFADEYLGKKIINSAQLIGMPILTRIDKVNASGIGPTLTDMFSYVLPNANSGSLLKGNINVSFSYLNFNGLTVTLEILDDAGDPHYSETIINVGNGSANVDWTSQDFLIPHYGYTAKVTYQTPAGGGGNIQNFSAKFDLTQFVNL